MSGDVPKGWREGRLKDVCEEVERRLGNGEKLEVLSVAKRGVVPQSQTYDKEIASEDVSRYRVIHPGEFGLAPMALYYGAIGRYHGEAPGIISPAYNVFRHSANADPRFLEALIRIPRMVARYEALSQGGNLEGKRKLTPFDAFETVKINIPPIAEQRAIAEVLGAVEDAIAKTEALIAQLKEVSSSMLSNRIAGFSRDVASVDVGSILLEGPKSGLSPVCQDEPPGIGVLKLSAVNKGRLNWRENVKFADIPKKAATQLQLKIGDFLVIRGSGSREIVGSGCRVTEADLPPFPCIFPDLVIRLRANSQKVIPEYLAVMWDTPIIRGQIRQAAKSTNGIYKINQTDIRELRMPLPPADVQREIVMLIDGIHARLSVEQRMLMRLVKTRDAFAQELLSGRLRLPESMTARHRDKPERVA